MVLGDGGPPLVLPRLAKLPWKVDSVIISESEMSQPLGPPLVGQGSGDVGRSGGGEQRWGHADSDASGCDSLFMISDETCH